MFDILNVKLKVEFSYVVVIIPMSYVVRKF